jgi:hypothetical protein
MRRYWKIVLLVPFIVLCIGTYYIDAASSNNYPNYYLKHQAGDEKEASGVSFQANYTNQSLTIRSDGSVYQNNESFLDSLTSNHYLSPEIEKLQKQHRNFMRGKNNPASLFEDQKVIGYVDIESNYISGKGHYRFIVSVYDKKQKSTSSFKVTVPQENEYQILAPNDVQIEGQMIKLVTINTKKSTNNTIKNTDNSLTEVHLYKLNLNKMNVETDQVILAGNAPDINTRVEIGGIYQAAPTMQSRYTVFQIGYSKLKKTSESYELYATYKRELLYFDYESNKLMTIQSDLVDDMLQQDDPNIVHSKDELLSVLNDPMGTRVVRYSLTEKKIKSEITIETNQFKSNGKGLTSARIANHRLYMMAHLKLGTFGEAPAMVVADMDTGRILYEGYISRKDNKAISNLMIYNIVIQ